MNDLISREAVRERFNKLYGSEYSASELLDSIPTAYNLKKVIEKLEEELNDAYMWTGCYEDYDAYYDGKATAYEHAIRIIEENVKV